jgi:hypothetical protein
LAFISGVSTGGGNLDQVIELWGRSPKEGMAERGGFEPPIRI